MDLQGDKMLTILICSKYKLQDLKLITYTGNE